jgi:hypothetical protein
MLKERIKDSEHAFYLFVQSFALLSERRTMSGLFGIPLMT